MPDYSACNATACPDRGECVRYLMKPSPFRQRYVFPSAIGKDLCNDFWPHTEDDRPPFVLLTVEHQDEKRKETPNA